MLFKAKIYSSLDGTQDRGDRVVNFNSIVFFYEAPTRYTGERMFRVYTSNDSSLLLNSKFLEEQWDILIKGKANETLQT